VASPPEQDPESARPAPSLGTHLYNALAHLGGIVLAVMTLAVFVQVVLRYLGLTGIDGLEEVPRYLFVWLVVLGAAAAMWRHEHTVLDYFVNLFRPEIRAAIFVLTNAAGIAFFAYMIWLSFTLVPNSALQTSAGLGLSLDYVFMAVPVGSALIIVPMLRNIYFALRGSWRKSS
jgi:TRAP-type transport system small permease protein